MSLSEKSAESLKEKMKRSGRVADLGVAGKRAAMDSGRKASEAKGKGKWVPLKAAVPGSACPSWHQTAIK
jgi:hypothetical protein